MSENKSQRRNRGASRRGPRRMRRTWCFALLALATACGHRLLGAAPATPTVEVKETERVIVRHNPADEDTATVQKVLTVQLQGAMTPACALVMTQKLPPAWQLSTADFVPVVRVGTGDPQRLHGAVTGTGTERVAEVRLPTLPGRHGETTLQVTYGARLKPVPKLPDDASVTLTPKQLRAKKPNRVTVALRLGSPPATSPGGLHATLWAPPKSTGLGFRVVTPPKGFATMDGCGPPDPGSTGGLWRDPTQALKWVVEMRPIAPGKTAIGAIQVDLSAKTPLVPSPTIKGTPKLEVRHVGTYLREWCESLFAGGGGSG